MLAACLGFALKLFWRPREAMPGPLLTRCAAVRCRLV
jgi:hypothetical protein